MRPQDRLIAADLTVRDPRWATVLARDSSADGQFYYSVRSTGVYCRPSCAARPARPENVRFHTSREDAEAASAPANAASRTSPPPCSTTPSAPVR